jgi:hypothetical protein
MYNEVLMVLPRETVGPLVCVVLVCSTLTESETALYIMAFIGDVFVLANGLCGLSRD